ncbi:MAG: 50S ribosomal protein L11 methyltransferase [Firmicutes bacterium]|nr:50S ribosomal protein L11 methyltransferase [Bacillota bacterium]
MVNSDLHLRWLLDVPSEQEDALSDWLVEVGASAMYREADPPFTFFAYFPVGTTEPDATELAAFPGVKLLRHETFADEDWLARSREGFGRIEVGSRFLIKPLWDQEPVPDDRMALVVNPGLAFGTGGHETTRLCMGLLEELAEKERLGSGILDIGAGTGILALTAYLLGGRDITAFDVDPDCGPAMNEFIDMNYEVLQGAHPFDAFVGSLDDPKVRGPYHGLLANILLETIQELLPRMAELAAPGGWLIASGILAERQDEALVSLSLAGFRPLKVVREGEWIAILCERS